LTHHIILEIVCIENGYLWRAFGGTILMEDKMGYLDDERAELAKLKTQAKELRFQRGRTDGSLLRLNRKIEEKEATIGRLKSQYGSSCGSTGSYCGRGWM